MERCDFLIIGAGMAGASAGYFLSQHGRAVILEQESQPGYHTTGRSAAFYAPSYGNEYVRALTLASGDFLRNPPDGFADVPLLRPRGALYIGREDQVKSLADFRMQLVETGGYADELTTEQAVDRCSALRADYVAGAVFEEDCHDIDVAALHQGFLRGLTGSGALVCDAPVSSLQYDGKNWVANTGMGQFCAPVLVNAAGAWADQIASLAGVQPAGLVPRRRTIAVLPGPEIYDDSWPLVLDVDDAFYFKPESGRVLTSPGDETPWTPSDVQPEEMDIALAVDRIATATHITAQKIEAKWAGLRTFAPDRTPVVGFEPGHAGFFWFAGQGGYGIQTAPAMGQLAADLIIDGIPSVDLVKYNVEAASYAADRFR